MPPTTCDNNYSTLLQFLYQELLSSENHDNAKETLLTYFQEANCDNSQLDIIHTCFQKATLDTKAFRARAGEQQHIAPTEFSHRLVQELTKKYQSTRELSSRITGLEEICTRDESLPSTTQLPLQEAISQFSNVRKSSLNLEAAMINICDHNLRSHMKSSGGHTSGNNRHTSAYDEQVLTLRKKLRDWTLVWGTEGVSRELLSGGAYPYVPLRGGLYGNPEILFGTSETNIQGTMVTSGTIIGLRVAQKNFFYQKLLWDAYTALMELNTTYPSRLFPLPLGVFRDKHSNASTFAFEYPLSPSSVSSLQSQVKGSSTLLPLRSFLYTQHESNRRVLAHALRHYPAVVELWCSQFGQAYRVLQHFPHIQYRFNHGRVGRNSAGAGGGDGVAELVNADVFVREDGSLVLGNAMVSVEEEEETMDAASQSTAASHVCNTEPLVHTVSTLLSECLSISRAIAVQLDHAPPLGIEDVDPVYLQKIDEQLHVGASHDGDVEDGGGGSIARHDRSEFFRDGMGYASPSVVYLGDECGLDIFPQLRMDTISGGGAGGVSVSSNSTFVLFIEEDCPSLLKVEAGGELRGGQSHRMGGGGRGTQGHSKQQSHGDQKRVLENLLASKSNIVVKMTSADSKIISVVSANGNEIHTRNKTAIDANNNTIITLPSGRNKGLDMKPKKGFHFRVKAKSPGVAYVTICQSAASPTADSSSSHARDTHGHARHRTQSHSRNTDVLYSVTLKICVIDYPISKSANLCEIVALSESSFWTPLHRPLHRPTEESNPAARDKERAAAAEVNSTLYLDQVFTAQAFRHRLSDSSTAKVHRQWTEIQQILIDNSSNQTSNKDPTAMLNSLFKHTDAGTDGPGPDNSTKTAEDLEEGGAGVINAEDEYLVSQVLKNKLYDEIIPPPTAEDLVATQRKGLSGTSGSNQHLRYPQNTYTRGGLGGSSSDSSRGAEARSVRRPPGEKGWK